MDDLEEVRENFVETFSCSEEQSTKLSSKPFPSNHANLLAASPHYGYLFVAIGSTIAVYRLSSLRKNHAEPVTVVDLNTERVDVVHAIAVAAQNALIARVTRNRQSNVLILDIPSLVEGNCYTLSGPKGEVRAFAVCEMSPFSSNYFVTLHDFGVQTYSLTATAATVTWTIKMASTTCVAISADAELVATGTVRGSVSVHNAQTGALLTTIVEVESGWVPAAVHFADNRSVLVAYEYEKEIRHVVWQLSEDGTDVSAHLSVGEICLASLFATDEDADEADAGPIMTCISLHEWNMCVIGSSKSSDVEVIRKMNGEWELWKFDEGKSPTLPTDDADDDTYCLGLAFDLNNTAKLPGTDSGSVKIEAMPRVIVYTSDSMLLPFALVDYNPGASCDAVRDPVSLPPAPPPKETTERVSLREQDTIDSSQRRTTAYQSLEDSSPAPDSGFDNTRQALYPKKFTKAPVTGLSEADEREKPLVNSHEVTLRAKSEDFSTERSTENNRLSSREVRPNSFKDAAAILTSFSFNESKPLNEGFIQSVQGSLLGDTKASDHIENERESKAPTKQSISLSPQLEKATTSVSSGKPLDLLRSIFSEMSAELDVSIQAEKAMLRSINVQKEGMNVAIADVRQDLGDLLDITRLLFQKEIDLRKSVSMALGNVLSLSREFERMSLEFRVKEADGFSRSLRSEETESDEKIASKETELLRSLLSVEERINAEIENQSQNSGSIHPVHQVYSALSLQGIRIKRVRNMLSALFERIDAQDQGGRLSNLGLSLARLEKLAIHDATGDRPLSRTTQDRDTPFSVSTHAMESEDRNSISNANVGQGEDSQLLSADVRTVLRRLAMRKGRANISITRQPQTIVREVNDGLYRFRQHGTEEKPQPASRPAISNAPNKDAFSMTPFVRSAPSQPNEIINRTVNGAPQGPHGIRQELSDEYGTGVSKKSTEKSEPDSPSLQSRLLPNDKSLRVARGSNFQSISSHERADLDVQSRVSLGSTDRQSSAADSFPHGHTQPAKRPSNYSSSRPPLSSGDAFSQTRRQKSNQREESEHLLRKKAASPFEVASDALGDEQISHSSASTAFPFGGIQKRDRPTNSFANLSVHKQSSDEDIPSSKEKDDANGLQKAKFPTTSHSSNKGPESRGGGKRRQTVLSDEEDEERPQYSVSSPNSQDSSPLQASNSSNAAEFTKISSGDQSNRVKASSFTREKFGGPSESISTSSLFAALPPDPDPTPTHVVTKQAEGSPLDIPGKDGKLAETTGRQQSAAELKDKAKETLSFTKAEEGNQSDAGHADSAHVSRSSLSVGFSGQNDLFAALPPDTNNATSSPGTALEATTFPFSDKNADVKTSEAPIFGKHAKNARRPSTTLDEAVKLFGTPVQYASDFGQSLFPTTALGNQIAVEDVTTHQDSTDDGSATDESDEVSIRMEGGMDTAASGTGFFTTSSPASQSHNSFGFGASGSMPASMPFRPQAVSSFGSVGPSQPFGQVSQQSAPSALQATPTAFGMTSSIGAAPAFGVQSSFGVASSLGAGSGFGEQSRITSNSLRFDSNSGQQSFRMGMSPQGVMGQPAFGTTTALGGFGQTSTAAGGFGMTSGGFGGVTTGSNSSPFSSAPNIGAFGGASGGGSGFAALANSQPGSLSFGSGSGPPSFTSAAFSQRRV